MFCPLEYYTVIVRGIIISSLERVTQLFRIPSLQAEQNLVYGRTFLEHFAVYNTHYTHIW